MRVEAICNFGVRKRAIKLCSAALGTRLAWARKSKIKYIRDRKRSVGSRAFYFQISNVHFASQRRRDQSYMHHCAARAFVRITNSEKGTQRERKLWRLGSFRYLNSERPAALLACTGCNYSTIKTKRTLIGCLKKCGLCVASVRFYNTKNTIRFYMYEPNFIYQR